MADQLKEQGYTLNVKEFTDYVQPNTVTEEGEVDANYFQHQPYLDSFNEEKGTHLVSVEAIHFEPFGLYAGKTATLDALADGATVAVPNDTTNEARALLLLQQEGLIKLADGAGITATTKDIVENPKNLKIQELEAANIPTPWPTWTSPASTATTLRLPACPWTRTPWPLRLPTPWLPTRTPTCWW